KLHKGALKELEAIINADTQSDTSSFMFIFSLLSVAFAGGMAGGWIAPWVKQAPEKSFKYVIRSGLQEIGKTLSKEVTGSAVKTLEAASAQGAPEPLGYEPVSPDAFDVYLEKKEALDGCFARLNKL